MKALKAFLFYFWQFTYGICQNIIGIIMFIIYKLKGSESEVYHYAVITYIEKKNFGGVSLGMFIFINKNTEGDRRHDTRIHEYGHTVQTMILGPAWLFIIALPSMIWCGLPYFNRLRREKDISYYWLYCEGWSNLCGLFATKEKFLTEECLNRGRFGKPI